MSRVLNGSKSLPHAGHDRVTGHGGAVGDRGVLAVNSKNWTRLSGFIWSCFTDTMVHVSSLGCQTEIPTRIPFFSVKPQRRNCPANRPSVKTSGPWASPRSHSNQLCQLPDPFINELIDL